MAWHLKTKWFSRWMRSAGLTDSVLLAAIDEMKRGLIDADLGGGVVKKRVALPGRGKRGGSRTIIATNRDDRWIFLFGFEKNDMENVASKELNGFQRLAVNYLNYPEGALLKAIETGELQEIRHEPDA